jgi:hypothetical protein
MCLGDAFVYGLPRTIHVTLKLQYVFDDSLYIYVNFSEG